VNDYVTVPSAAAFDVDALTVEAWFRLARPVGATQARIVNRQVNQGSGGQTWGLEIFGDGYGGSGTRLVFHWNSAGNLSAPVTLATGVWYHVAGTNDGTILRLYLNGSQVASMPNTSPHAASQNGPIVIGKTAPLRNFYFPGEIDEVRVWDRARSATAIAQAMSVHATEGSPGLLANWSFREGSGTRTADNSGGEHHATLEGGPAWVAEGWTSPPPETPVPPGAYRLIQADGRPLPSLLYEETMPSGSRYATSVVDGVLLVEGDRFTHITMTEEEGGSPCAECVNHTDHQAGEATGIATLVGTTLILQLDRPDSAGVVEYQGSLIGPELTFTVPYAHHSNEPPRPVVLRFEREDMSPPSLLELAGTCEITKYVLTALTGPARRYDAVNEGGYQAFWTFSALSPYRGGLELAVVAADTGRLAPSFGGQVRFFGSGLATVREGGVPDGLTTVAVDGTTLRLQNHDKLEPSAFGDEEWWRSDIECMKR
jgi:hypothetical protein